MERALVSSSTSAPTLWESRSILGGFAQAYRAGAGTPARRTSTARGVMQPTGAVGMEPTLGVNDDGWIFVNTWYGPSDVLRSKDQGETWRVVSPLRSGPRPTSHDPYLYVDPRTGRLFSADLQRNLECHAISHSDDGGETWITSALCGEVDHQTLFAGAPALSVPTVYPNVVYYCAVNVGVGPNSFGTTCFKSLDGGIVFTPTGSPPFVGFDPSNDKGNFGVAGWCGGGTHHGVVDGDGTIYLPRTYCGTPTLAISDDEGATWRHVVVADNGTSIGDGEYQHDAGVAVDGSGNIYVTWIAQDKLPYLAISKDGGASFSEPVMVAPPGITETAVPGAIEVGRDGSIALAYMGSENSPFPTKGDCTIAQEAFCPSEADYYEVDWNGYITVTTDALAKQPRFITVRVNPRSAPLEKGTCFQRCGDIGDFIDITIDGKGLPWAAFVRPCTGSTQCSTAGEVVVASIRNGPRLR
ncbi:MAG TPA: sialidase family protein [Actinomycetota bacterium]|nr:sialidase family protein [Actinomycetota bacterium]